MCPIKHKWHAIWRSCSTRSNDNFLARHSVKSKKMSKPVRDEKTGKFAKKGATAKLVRKAESDVARAEPEQVNFLPDTTANAAGPQARAAYGDATAADPDPNGVKMAEQYPTDGLSGADERDRLQQIKMSLQTNTPGITPYGRMTFKDEDAYWLLKKEEAAKAAAFEEWFARQFDRASPAQKKLARETFPRFYQQRLETLDRNLETLRKVARLRIQGPKTSEDVALMFAADNGLLPMATLENILHPERVNLPAAQQFQRGLFNPNSWFLGPPQDDVSRQRQSELYHGRTNPALAAPAGGGNATWPVTNVPRQDTQNATVLRSLGLIA
jgi:hypothetical protein